MEKKKEEALELETSRAGKYANVLTRDRSPAVSPTKGINDMSMNTLGSM